MKVLFNQTQQINYRNTCLNKNFSNPRIERFHGAEYSAPPCLSMVNFPNISFKHNGEARFLLNQADKLFCAYSGKPFLQVNKIYTGLQKAPNALSALNILRNHADFLQTIEAEIFDIFEDFPNKGKKNFKDILMEFQPESLPRLEEKQKIILTSTDSILPSLSNEVASKVSEIRDNAFACIDKEFFGRKTTLLALNELIKSLQAGSNPSPEEAAILMNIFKSWYALPSSSKDLDAFIVKCSKKSHEEIAKRLVSPSGATIEHINPLASIEDKEAQETQLNVLGNMLLVLALHNNDRLSLDLASYMELNPEINIHGNLQKYADRAMLLTNSLEEPLRKRPDYVPSIIENISSATDGSVIIQANDIKPTSNNHKKAKQHYHNHKKKH